ncbi:TonB-dependent receptor domain-containing protein [Nonlabens sp. Asnod3-H03]|uniref:TonB-dependent receptor n=1 Tax=Nonlabens sp. Asnod3-H03 TaxID=3160580 RepID=UPI0038630809
MKKLLLIFIILTTFPSIAQVVTIVDIDTNEPLVNVAVYNKSKSKSAVSDIEGQVDLKIFNDQEFIYFQSISYATIKIIKTNISKDKFIRLQQQSDYFNPIILSASKFEQRAQDIPQKIFAVNKEEITFNNPQTSADLLQQSGQVFVQKSQQGGGSPMIRGFSTNRLLITVDGVRMNTAIFRSGNLQNVISIDPLSVDRSEVILGPGSVVYGSDAIGGVMNFYTLKPQFQKDSVQITGSGLLRYASANNENTGHLNFNIGGEKWASATSITVNFFDDLRMGTHGPDDYLRESYVVRRDDQDISIVNDNSLIQRPTRYDQLNILQKLRYQPTQDFEFGLGVIYSGTGDFPRYDSLDRFRESGEPRNAEWFYGPQKWLMTNFNVTHRGDGKWYDKAVLTQAYQYFEESRITRDFQDSERFVNEEQVDAISTSLDFERRDRESNALFYGGEFIHNRVRSNGYIQDIDTNVFSANATRYPDGSSWRSLAAYASYQWKVSSQMIVNTGLRYNHIWIDADFTANNAFFNFPFEEATINTGALTGGIGATYVTNNKWELRSNLSTAFRAPNIDDLGKLFDPSPGTVIVPNPDLESEYSYNSEIGVKKTWNDKLTLDASVYYTYLKDALVAQNDELNGQSIIEYQGEQSQVQSIQNGEKASIYGLELGLNYKLNDQFSLIGHYNITKGEQTEVDGNKIPVRHVAPAFGDLQLNYEKESLKLGLFAQFNGQFDFEDLDPSQQSRPYLYALDSNGNPYAPSWYTLNIRSRYSLNEALSLNVTLENMTDQRYRTYSSGVSAAGRNLILGARYLF